MNGKGVSALSGTFVGGVALALFVGVALFLFNPASASASTPASLMEQMTKLQRMITDMKAGGGLVTPAPAPTVAATASTTKEVPVIPRCQLSFDKNWYLLNDPIKVTWKSTGTEYAEFIDMYAGTGKENLAFPAGRQAASGAVTLNATVLGLPTVTVRVTSVTGHTSTCSRTIAVLNAGSSKTDKRLAPLFARLTALGQKDKAIVAREQKIVQDKMANLLAMVTIQQKIDAILRTAASSSSAVVKPVVSSDSVETTTELSNEDTVGTFVVTFDVTAQGGDIYIPKAVGVDGGVVYRLEGSASTTGTKSAVFTSMADEVEAGVYKVSEGDTETFTLTTTYDPKISGTYQMQAMRINWKGDLSASTLNQYPLLPRDAYKTEYLSIQGS